jgi:hypothetical protein
MLNSLSDRAAVVSVVIKVQIIAVKLSEDIYLCHAAESFFKS